MMVDIHTHNQQNESSHAIQNLAFTEAEKFFSSSEAKSVSVGIHPWYIDTYTDTNILQIGNWINDKRLLAIGECGLDKNSKSPIDKQLEIFTQQIMLSEKFKKAIIIHCVGCFNELFELKKKINPKQLWIIHGFRGKPELANQALKEGCMLSYGEHFNIESVKLTPIEKLFIETDESKLTIADIYSQIANTKHISATELIAGKILFNSLHP
jgi:TatD DNase family protein